MKNVVLTTHASTLGDSSLTAFEFIKKYAALLNTITVEFHNEDASNTSELKAYYRPNWLSMGQKNLVPSKYIGTISEDEIFNVLSLRQYEDDFLTGKEYRFNINTFFVKTAL